MRFIDQNIDQKNFHSEIGLNKYKISKCQRLIKKLLEWFHLLEIRCSEDLFFSKSTFSKDWIGLKMCPIPIPGHSIPLQTNQYQNFKFYCLVFTFISSLLHMCRCRSSRFSLLKTLLTVLWLILQSGNILLTWYIFSFETSPVFKEKRFSSSNCFPFHCLKLPYLKASYLPP